jgi:hypothetical protein
MPTVTQDILAETVSIRPIVVRSPLASKSHYVKCIKRDMAVGLAATDAHGKELEHDSWPKIGIGWG